MQNPAPLSPSLSASELGVEHLAPRYDAPGGISDVSAYELSRNYTDPRYHSAYGTASLARPSHAALSSDPQSEYESQHLEGNCNGYSNSFDNCRNSVYRNGPPAQPFKEYWSNGSASGYHSQPHHLSLSVQQSYAGNSICTPLPASSPSPTPPVLTHHQSQTSPTTAHPSSWSLSPRTTPSPQVPSPGLSRNRSPAHCASPYLSQLPSQHVSSQQAPSLTQTVASIASANGNSAASSSASQGAFQPLQSLQQMVDPESSNSSHQSFDPSLNQPNSPSTTTSRNKMQHPQPQPAHSLPACYSASDSTSSPYPTYYNLDQNRLCSAQEMTVQGGGSGMNINSQQLQEKQQQHQVRNGMGNEIKADGRVLPPQPEDVNQKTSYYSHSTANCVTPDTRTPVNGIRSPATTAVPPPHTSAWNETNQWHGNSSLANGQTPQWPTNGTASGGGHSAEPYPGMHAAATSQPHPPDQEYVRPAAAPAPQAVASFHPSSSPSLTLQHTSPVSWPASEALPLALPGGAPGQVQKKKRGRPFGSKNKPKNPALPASGGSSGTPSESATAGRKKPGRKPKGTKASLSDGADTLSHIRAPIATIASGDSSSRLMPAVTTMTTSEELVSQATSAAIRSGKKNVGPFIRVDKDHGLPVYSIANCLSSANTKDSAFSLKQSAHVLSRGRRPPDAVHSKLHKTTSSSAPPTSSASGLTSEKDSTWICVFCKQGPHFECLGDLFGPYFIPKSAHQSPNNSSKAQDESPSKTGRKRKLSNETGTDAMNNSQSSSASQEDLREIWFHEDCISWSSGVYLLGHSIRNMEEIVRDSADSVCSSCALNGANLGCIFSGCQQRYHFSCARKCSCDFNEENYSILCDRHKDKFQKTSGNTDSFLSSTIF